MKRKNARWTENDLAAHLARVDLAAVQAADVERRAGHAAGAAHAGEKSHPRYRIAVHSRRRRLADPDGICAKWAIDGLVESGLLPDDSAEWVEAVTFTQEKSDVEDTRIDVILIG